jgi:tripartite-type tricarboxylate transporter receptor subunit TctC
VNLLGACKAQDRGSRRVAFWPVLLASVLLAFGPVKGACAQESRTVRVVVPAPPGGNLDFTARLVAHRLAALTGDAHVVENRPGANTYIGTEYALRAKPDGRTILVTGTSVVINPWLYANSFSGLTDMRPVAQLTIDRYVLVATAGLPVTGAGDLARLSQERPGGLNCGAPPGPMSLACEQLAGRLRGNVKTIPYPGVGPAVNALLGGHVDFIFLSSEAVGRHVESGRLKALALSHPIHLAGVPSGLPLITELWPGFLLEGGHGVFVPLETPEAVVRQLHRDISLVLAEPELTARMREGGNEPGSGSTEQFIQRLRRLESEYGRVIQQLGITRK